MIQVPMATGLFLCEQVIIEEKTRNVTPVNCFTLRKVNQFPSEPFSFVAFAILTNGSGEITLELTIQRLDTLEEIYQRFLSFRLSGPLQEARCLFRINDCSFPTAGSYQATLMAGNEFVAQRKFRLVPTENPE